MKLNCLHLRLVSALRDLADELIEFVGNLGTLGLILLDLGGCSARCGWLKVCRSGLMCFLFDCLLSGYTTRLMVSSHGRGVHRRGWFWMTYGFDISHVQLLATLSGARCCTAWLVEITLLKVDFLCLGEAVLQLVIDKWVTLILKSNCFQNFFVFIWVLVEVVV